MKHKVRPLGSKVLVSRLDAESKTAGGIVLPENAQEKQKRGKVHAVGKGRLLDNGERQSPEVKEGDEVIFTSYAGTEVKINDVEFIIMDESDVLAVIGG